MLATRETVGLIAACAAGGKAVSSVDAKEEQSVLGPQITEKQAAGIKHVSIMEGEQRPV